MLLQVNIHFQDSNDKEMITSTLCKNGKELQAAVLLANKDQQKQVFLDNLFSKVSAIELIKVPQQDQNIFYDVLYYLTFQNGFKIITIVLTDKVSKNIIQIDGSKLIFAFNQEESNARYKMTEQKRVPLPNSKADYDRQQKFIKEQIDRTVPGQEGNQVYGILLNDKTNGILCKSNKVRILSNFQIQQVSLFEIYLHWTDYVSKRQIQMNYKTEPREIRIRTTNPESVKLAEAMRYESSFDLDVLDDITMSAILVINNQKIVYEFPFTYQK